MTRFLALLLFASTAVAVEPPRLLDSDLQIELIASEPELVTPTGCCFDDDGSLLVIECHTHFPPEDYAGPKTDRIYRFDDRDGDGVLDRQSLFYEGGTASMNIVNLGDGSFAVATRSDVVRLRDSDGDGVADQRDVLLSHNTAANYPHNGLSGLALAADGWLYVGQGENFGEPYELVGTDGSKQIGGGEGGNVFRCRVDGSDVQRVATGFWNPFGLCFDSSHRLWGVGNDPDAMPPNRLMHIVPGGDYGFQFRFGRAGVHPLQAWDGEFPGTLPMTAGTGEAACAVVPHGADLWVTSWGDNRIERHRPVERGATWGTTADVVVQGDASFRPVAMAVAGDDSLYVTDWVDRSYPVHGKGRLWRVSRKSDTANTDADLPKLTATEKQAERLRSDDTPAVDARIQTLDSPDPFLSQAAMFGLVQTNQLSSIERARAATAEQRVGLLTAWRWQELVAPENLSADERRGWIQWGLQDDSESVRLAAIRWATERDCKDQLAAIRSQLQRPDVSPRLFSAVIASIAYLETGSTSGRSRDPAIEKLMVQFAGNPDHAPALRAMAIRRIPADAKVPTDQQLRQWVDDQRERDFAMEVVRLLAARGGKTALDQLAGIAGEERFDLETRADALAALSRNAGSYAALINRSSLPKQPATLRTEARRMLKRNWATDPSRPHKDDLEAWMRLVGEGGNVDAGRRVFFRTTCVNCHRHSGRGAQTGPDLSTLSGNMTRQRVLDSILHPGKEVGPLYVPWQVLTTDGNVLTGLKLDRAGAGNSMRFQGADGEIFEVPLADVEQQEPIDQSIMPTGLESTMGIDELRDLIAFLTQE
ncbi:PVC-type heme-binding CxxCH protein [Stieleria mannarensis]|uniref:PVC-type heme-binding CxxCH protein n=1 Tax=Stieleria mannarensis TaxID=2755585 RepID=UPI001604423E|nr:PVC-type heme-binding CxxCH protein [Rhodopirellula sp. JC639]